MSVQTDAVARYVHWGVVQISLTNLLVVLGMLVVFVLALVVPFPGRSATVRPPEPPPDPTQEQDIPGWTAAVRRRVSRTVPPGQWLPDRQPAYVRSWIYVFGVATLAALVVVLASGIALAVEGPTWWHGSSVGHFVNSAHLWSVELFFACMVIHLWIGSYHRTGKSLVKRREAAAELVGSQAT